MKKVLFLVMILSAGLIFAASEDLSGTWEGGTYVDGNPVTLTLVLTKTESGYTGKMSDDVGFTQDTEIENVKLEGKEMSFSFTADNGSDYLTVFVKVTIEGDTMTGTWESEDGNSGEVEMKKQ